MKLDLAAPPDDIFADIDELDTAISADLTGDRMRRLLSFIRESEIEGREFQLRESDLEKKNFAGLAVDALGAARRIIATCWQRRHGKELGL